MDMTGWWFFAYPSEKWWTSSVGMMNFPMDKYNSCSKPPTIFLHLPSSSKKSGWIEKSFLGNSVNTCLQTIFRSEIQTPSCQLQRVEPPKKNLGHSATTRSSHTARRHSLSQGGNCPGQIWRDLMWESQCHLGMIQWLVGGFEPTIFHRLSIDYR